MSGKKKYSFISTIILSLFMSDFASADVGNIEFETRALELGDKTNINLSNFTRSDYLPSGVYALTLELNNREIESENFDIIEDKDNSQICFKKSTIEKFELKESYFKKIILNTANENPNCILINGYEGISARVDREKSILLVTVPQLLLKYSDPDWPPPSQWDDGIAGVLLDYTLNGNLFNSRDGSSTKDISSYGTAGINYGAWRFRTNYNASLYTSDDRSDKHEINTSAVYITRALKTIGANLAIGKKYFLSDVFDSIDYQGFEIISDNRMLPPALRGYAPRLSGVAKTNAKVIVTRAGSIIYEKNVPPGPFVIEDLNDTTSGVLKMIVREENGQEEVSTIETSNIPFLTRSGHIRYKTMMGKMEGNYGGEKIKLIISEVSLGILSKISLFGGATVTDRNYHAINTGIGYDMGLFGALSVDITHANALIQRDRWTGQSYRLNYSKVFDSIDSQITFAGYRFSDEHYLSLNNMANMLSSPTSTITNKESYNIVASKSFRDLGFSINAIYNKQTFWQGISDSNTYGLSISKSFDIDKLKNINAYLSINRTEYISNMTSQKQKANNSIYLSFSIPLSTSEYINAGSQISNGDLSPSITYSNNKDWNNIWSIGASSATPNFYDSSNFNGNIQMNRNAYNASVNGSVGPNSYYLAGSIKSGITATMHGVGIHRDGYSGNTRLVIDTDGIEGVYIGSQGSNNAQNVVTNSQGIAVLNDIPDYYRTDFTIDTNKLPNDIESNNPNIQMVFTQGAIGYRKLNLYRGIKMFIKLTDSQGNVIPFGSIIYDEQEKRQVAVVGEKGEVYLSGVSPKSILTTLDSEKKKCNFSLTNTNSSLSSFISVTCNQN
ncbi:fimbria/pilus outer membrane usher protein [Providencia rettgeri]|uniref:fimbria/pilus outer membrane usher protein n=1 Tax=Providencia rettgeri TaxID=587 RepID=UPI0034E07F21